MPLFKRRSREPPTMLGYWLRSSGDCPVGYHRLLDIPEVAACISRISAIISSVPIYLMENTRKGDVRVHDGLSRLVDIDPWPGMATRSGLHHAGGGRRQCVRPATDRGRPFLGAGSNARRVGHSRKHAG